MFYIKQELPINGQIRAKDVQLISENGEKLGIVPLARALELATEKELDLLLDEMINEGLITINKQWINEKNEYPYSLTQKGRYIWRNIKEEEY